MDLKSKLSQVETVLSSVCALFGVPQPSITTVYAAPLIFVDIIKLRGSKLHE